METTENKYVAVAYELYTTGEDGVTELVEKAPVEHPFQFISGMGFTLDAFEQQVAPLNQGDKFDFVLAKEDAYGDYEEARVLHLDRQMFCVNGHFDKENIYPGNVITLLNEDGNHLQGLVVVMRPATNDEIQGFVNRMSGEGCCCDGCGGGCGDHEEGHADGHHCCGHHEDGHCCGGGHCH